MKKITLFTTALLLSLNSFAQATDWLWAKSAGGTVNDIGYGVATDLNGNVYITGFFQSPTITFGTTNLTNVGS